MWVRDTARACLRALFVVTTKQRSHGSPPHLFRAGANWDAVALDGSLTDNACFASGWKDKIETLVFDFLSQTGLTMVETDGACANTCALAGGGA